MFLSHVSAHDMLAGLGAGFIRVKTSTNMHKSHFPKAILGCYLAATIEVRVSKRDLKVQFVV